MKKLIFISTLTFALVGGMASTALAQPNTEVAPTSKAVIVVDKEVHDYGTIEQGADGECVFTVTNTGTEPLIISLCKGSCGCTVPVCPQEPIAPGGPINKSVTITSNANNAPSKTVRISGDVKAKPTGGAPVNNGMPANN